MDIIYGKNYEGYADPTACTAIANLGRRDYMSNRGDVYDYTVANGKEVKVIVIKPYRNYSLCVIGSDETYGDDVITIRGIGFDMSRPRSFKDLTDFCYQLTPKEMGEVATAYAAVCGVTKQVVEKVVEVPVGKVVEKIVEVPVEKIVESKSGDSEYWKAKYEAVQEMNTQLLDRLCR